jgi:hypothetical protein
MGHHNGLSLPGEYKIVACQRYAADHTAAMGPGMGGPQAFPPQSAPPPQAYPSNVPFDSTGQNPPPGMKPRVTATLWEDEGSLCFQVEAKGVCVARREGKDYI